MPGYVAKALKQFQHKPPHKHKHAPFPVKPITYGAKQQFAKAASTAPLVSEQDKKFIQKPLPAEAQFSPVYALLVTDFNKDGHEDILLGGNQSRAKPETGIYLGSYGLLLKGLGNGGFIPQKQKESGLFIKGEIRSLTSIRIKDKLHVIVGKNNDFPAFLSY